MKSKPKFTVCIPAFQLHNYSWYLLGIFQVRVHRKQLSFMRLMMHHAEPPRSSQELIYLHLICSMSKKKNVCFKNGAHKLPRVHILHSFDILIGIIRLQPSWKEKAISRNYRHCFALVISNVNEIRIRHRRGNKKAHVATSAQFGTPPDQPGNGCLTKSSF